MANLKVVCANCGFALSTYWYSDGGKNIRLAVYPCRNGCPAPKPKEAGVV